MARNILIIGGSSGIGLEITKLFAADPDNRLIVACRERGGLDELPDVEHQVYDVSERDAVLDLPETLDSLIYCPGTINLKPFGRISDDEFLGDLEINFLGAVRAVRLAHEALRKSGHGTIVLFSTVAVQTGLPYHASISGAKGAVEGLARSLAAEFSPEIRVNCLSLSLTDTPLAANLLGNDEKRKASEDRHPLKRVGDPAEVAKAAAFLSGPDSGFITGQVLQIDGGLSSLKLL